MTELIKFDDEQISAIKTWRKKFESQKTPEQHKGKLPMGGKMTDYVKSPYMINAMKEYCHELYNVKIVEIKDVVLPTSKETEHWVRIAIEILDRSTGNSVSGVGAARVRTNSEGVVVNYRHDLTAAETYAWKDAAKNMGIAADIYGKDVTEYTPDTQAILDSIIPEINKRYGKEELSRFLVKIETLEEEELIKYINKLKETFKGKTV
jgi:hypothetical protein